MPSIVGASHVSFSVSDLSGAVEWFEAVFGAEVMLREPGENRSATVLTLPQSNLMIGLVSFREAAKEKFNPLRTGLDHFAFLVEKESDLDEWRSHLDDNGVENSGAIAVPPGAILNFKGPDGIALSMFWRR